MRTILLLLILLCRYCRGESENLEFVQHTNGAAQNTDAALSSLDTSYYKRRCLRGYAASNFDLLDTDNYDKWMDDDTIMYLAETGTYKGPSGIAEYIGGSVYFASSFVELESQMLPISFNETICVAHFSIKIDLTTDPVRVGEPVGLASTFGFTLYWTVAVADDGVELNTTDVRPSNRFNNYDENYDFKTHRINVYFPNAYLRRLYGVELETDKVRDFVCDVIMSPGCNETRDLNQLSSHEECVTMYETLLSTNMTGSMDDYTKGCRILHAVYALKNQKHCPHLSFKPQQDYLGITKCQISSGQVPSDIFSEVELDFIQQQSITYGFDSQEQYIESDPVPVISHGVKALQSTPSEDTSKSPKDTGNESEFMRLQFFDPLIPCGDGSPSGVYVEHNPKVQNSQNHVLVFLGGAACTNPQDCEKAYRMEPFKFSTDYYPSTLEGSTVLSRDPTINPTMHNYTKWMVPYCSQDFFLGDIKKGKVGNFTHAGSLIFDAALKYWQGQVRSNFFPLDSTGGSVVLDNVVVVGISAGAIGVMNKIDTIRTIINSEEDKIKTRNLKIILDSPSVMSDLPHAGKNFKTAMVEYTNLSENPLCHPLNPFTRTFERMSALPCCLSTHCMLRYDERLSSFYDINWKTGGNNANNEEEILILDSAYDPVALMSSVDVSSDQDDDSSTDITSALFVQLEIGGMRKSRGVETAAFAKSMALQKMSQNITLEEFYDQPRVKWIFSSCYQHTFLVPSSSVLELSCLYGNYEDEQFDYVCRDGGYSFVIETDSHYFGVWRTPDTWDLAVFRDESIHEIVNNFVRGNFSGQLPSPVVLEGDVALLSYDTPDVIDFRLQPCVGPNCREDTAPSSTLPSCQAMIETANYFVPVPTGFVVVWLFVLLIFLAATPFLRISFTKILIGKIEADMKDALRTSVELRTSRLSFHSLDREEEEKVLRNTRKSQRILSDSALAIDGISVVMSDGKNIVTDVSISLKYGTLNALCGRSGSGKSTLLRALSLLHHPGIEVEIRNGSSILERTPKAFLRQHDDSVGFGKLTPVDYLRYTAQIIGCDKGKTADVLLFADQMFSRKKKNRSTDPENYFDAFTSTKIENLSGGQRRFLNIAATLLSEPKLLLLDEPLSGLDSASSLFVLEGLESIALVSDCAIFMTVHQPSERILEHYDTVFFMDGGQLTFQESVNPESVHELHTELEKRMISDSTSKPFQPIDEESLQQSIEPNNANRRSYGSDNYNGNINCIESGIKMFSKTIKQIAPLAHRLHLQFGWEPLSGCTLVIFLMFIAGLLRFEKFYPQKVVSLSLTIIGIPSVVFPHKVVEHALMWKAHKEELDDKKITPLAFQISTALLTFPVPIFSLLVGQILVYLIEGWSFDSFAYQWVVATVHLMCSFQLGRMLMVWFRGDFSKGIRYYVMFLVYAFIFNGVCMSTNKPPEFLRWLYWFSINFWGISGSVIRQFDSDVYSNTEYCSDLIACLVSDNNNIIRNLGFAPLSNTVRALNILTCVFVAFWLLEFAILHHRRTGS